MTTTTVSRVITMSFLKELAIQCSPGSYSLTLGPDSFPKILNWTGCSYPVPLTNCEKWIQSTGVSCLNTMPEVHYQKDFDGEKKRPDSSPLPLDLVLSFAQSWSICTHTSYISEAHITRIWWLGLRLFLWPWCSLTLPSHWNCMELCTFKWVV